MSLRRLRRGAFVAVAAGLSLVPTVAWACPVCFSATNDANRWAFIFTTGFLTFLPLSLLGGGIYWVVRRARQLDAEERAAAEPGSALAYDAEHPGADADVVALRAR